MGDCSTASMLQYQNYCMVKTSPPLISSNSKNSALSRLRNAKLQLFSRVTLSNARVRQPLLYYQQQPPYSCMILRHLCRGNYIGAWIGASSYLRSYFATGEKLYSITKDLVKMDSLEFDQLCQKVLDQYRRPSTEASKQKTLKPEKQDKLVQSKKNSKLQKNWSIVGDPAQSSVADDKTSEDIKFVYDSCSDAKVGFLKGDIHAELIFKLNKYLQQKQPKQLSKQFTAQQYKRILNLVTELKAFRIPKRGVKKSESEDQRNLYERQLILEMVSNQQSTQRYENVLDSLSKIGKLHLTSAFKSYLVGWFSPLCAAIKQEQAKCRDEAHLQGARKVYAQDFIRLSPERLTSVCLSELLKQITTILYRDYARDGVPDEFEQQKQPEFEQYDSIRYKPLCLTIAKWVSVQSYYEEQEKKFKMVMKLYDSINLSRKEEKNDLLRTRKESQIKQRVTNTTETESATSQNPQQEKISLQQKEKQMKKTYEDRVREIQQVHGIKFVPAEDRKQYLQEMANKFMRDHYKLKSDISEEAQFEIGSICIYLMKEILKTENRSGYKVPLLTLEHKYSKYNGEIYTDKRLKINDHFLNTILPIIQKQGDLYMHLDRSLPTIIPPLPWVEYQIGGYYLYPSTFMRISQCKVQERLIKYSDLSRVYNVLNSLSKIPWKINHKILQVVEAIWEEGGSAGEIPKRYSAMITTSLTKYRLEHNWQKKKQIARQIQKLRDEHSLRSDFNLKMNIARSYSKLDRFFYPHNVDFRGRVYPIPPHLNHIGNDLSRGLLMFADGKRIGEHGLKWLKIHCANLMGKDKATIPQKLEFVQANLGLIRSIAQNPLQNREWLHNEDCWQSLAAIIDLNAALKMKKPVDYVSYLHIHQDGSCNGLQHYAAMGRDTEGAYQVNLGPNERPGDVYTHVAKMVIKSIDKDIADPNSQYHELAKKVSGNIKRKTIKQTVMTSVYGVTFIGARQQIYRQLKDQAFLKSEDEEYAASIYLAKLTLQAISNLFSSAHLIKKWLIECAKVVAGEGNPMGWITPMGLPVVQPYRKQTHLDVVNTIIQNLKLTKRSEHLNINSSKQKSAFPPNYVHSLDSTHMMYTAQQCTKEDIIFAAVHDSYWTHAATVDRMNEILRDQFIKLHSEPLLENLKRSLEIRYPQLKFPDIPQRGDFKLEKIKESIYFFS